MYVTLTDAEIITNTSIRLQPAEVLTRIVEGQKTEIIGDDVPTDRPLV